MPKRVIAIAVTACILVATVASAQDSETIRVPYQGRVTDAASQPVPDATYPFVFRIFDDSTGGVQLWSESQTVETKDGLFHVFLGTQTPLEVQVFQATPPGQFHWFETEFNGEVQVPRVPVGETPLSGSSRRVDGDIETSKYHVFYGNLTDVEYWITVTADSGKSNIRLAHQEATDTTQQCNIRVDSTQSSLKLENKSDSGIVCSGLLINLDPDSSRIRQFVDTRGPEITIDKWEGPDNKGSVELKVDSVGPSVHVHARDTRGPEITLGKWEGPDNKGTIDLTIDTTGPRIYVHAQDTRPPEITIDKWEGPDNKGEVKVTVDSTGPSVNVRSQDTRGPEITIDKWEGPSKHGGIALGIDSNKSEVHVENTAPGGTGTTIDLQTDTLKSLIDLFNAPPGSIPRAGVGMSADSTGGQIQIELEQLSLGGTGFKVEVRPAETTLELRGFNGTNPGVHIITDGASAAVGIGTPVPTEELQVIGDICATGTIGVCSDQRYKRDIETIVEPVAMVQRLRGVEFNWRTEEFAEKDFSDARQVGLIAQEVLQVVPSVVSKGDDGFFSVDYGRLTPILIEAIKSQQGIIDRQQEDMEGLQKRLTVLEGLVSSLAKQIKTEDSATKLVTADDQE